MEPTPTLKMTKTVAAIGKHPGEPESRRRAYRLLSAACLTSKEGTLAVLDGGGAGLRDTQGGIYLSISARRNINRQTPPKPRKPWTEGLRDRVGSCVRLSRMKELSGPCEAG